VDVLLNGKPELPTQAATSNTYGFDRSLPPIPYDPDRARDLLADAGYPDGFTFIVQGVIGSGANDAAMYQLVAQDLAAVGVTMEVHTFPVTQLIRSVMEGGWDGDAFGVTFAAEPTLDVLRPMRNHSCLWPHPWYCDQRIMPKINEALVTFDEVRGLELRHDIMKFYRDEWVALYLYQIVRFAGTRANVRGFTEVNGFVAYEDIEFVDE
jgi:peptide/nickel transport system substrate-binding protein